MMTIEEKYAVFESILDRTLGVYLKERKFVFCGSEIYTSNSDKMRNIHFKYTCEVKCREIMICYIPIDFRGENDEWIHISISRIPKGYYSVLDILKHEKIPYDSSKFYLLNYEGSFEEQVQQFCVYLIELLDNYFQEWLSGEKWLDIPFDWMGYK